MIKSLPGKFAQYVKISAKKQDKNSRAHDYVILLLHFIK